MSSAFSLALLVLADKQGYTPYGYGMDTPVLVRASTSYGRGWQLLRSRGEKSTQTGPCDLPQKANSCSQCDGATGADDVLPKCLESPACGEDSSVPAPYAAAAAGKASILFVLHANASHLRFFYGRNVQKAYHSQLGLLVRAVHSLRAANTTLPIHVLTSGHRSAAAEARLTQLGVRILAPEVAPPVVLPKWASKWAYASFAKLRALALTQFETVILLDTDTVVLRNIDHLAGLPRRGSTPAFVMGFKCSPRRELRAAVGILSPSLELWSKARALMLEPTTAIYDDLGEQSVWRHLYKESGVHELPIGYAALRASDLSAEEWRKVHVLHDPNLLRKASRAGWKEARMADAVKVFDDSMAKELSVQMDPAIDNETKAAAKAAPPKNKSSKRHRGKRRAS